MPVPKRKRSRARRDKRFANKRFQPAVISPCSNCSFPVLSHQACPTCGFYKGQKVMTVKLDRHVRRVEARQAAKSAQASTDEQQAQE